MGKKMMKGLSAILVVVLLANIVILNQGSFVDAYVMDKAPILVERRIDENNVELDQEVTIQYQVLPQRIPADMVGNHIVSKDKEVFIVIDKSGSMDDYITSGNVRKTRNDFAVEAANNFLDHLKEQDNVRVGVILYGSDTSILKINGKKLFDINTYENEIRAFFNGGFMGGTNLGEALRVAARNLEQFGSAQDQHIVLLTDGEPTAFSFNTARLGTSRGWWDAIGYYQHGNYGWDLNDISSVDLKDYKANGDHAEKYFVNYGTSDYNGYSLEYARLMSKNAGYNDKLKSHFISFTYNEGSKRKLDQIAEEQPNAMVYATNDQLVLNGFYEDIADEITTDFVIDQVYFQDIIPDGMEVVGKPDFISLSNNMIYGKLENIHYSLNDEGDYYIPDTRIEFEVTVKVTEAKEIFVFPESDEAFVRYSDIDEGTSYRYFDQDNVLGFIPFEIAPYVSEVKITPDKSEVYQEDQVHVDYELVPAEVELDADKLYNENTKDIIVMLDTSNSMAWALNGNKNNVSWSDKRINIAKQAAKNFVDNFDGTDTNIAIITFDKYGDIRKVNGETFNNLSVPGSAEAIKDKISSFDLDLGTNMGDAYRLAYYEFLKREDLNTDKYIVFLSDGAPYYWMTQGGNSKTYDLDEDKDYLVTKSSFKGVSRSYGSYHYTLAAIDQITDSDLGVRQFIIGISHKSGDLTKLNEFGKHALSAEVVDGNYYYAANTPSDIEAAYTDIEVSIEDQIPINDMTFTHTVPEHLVPDVSQLPKGFSYEPDTRVLTGSLTNLTMTKNDDGNYVMNPAKVSITYGFDSSSDVFFQDDSVTLTYKDLLDRPVTVVGGNAPEINVLPTVPVINPVSDDDIIDYDEVEDVVVSGTAAPDVNVYVSFKDTNNDVIQAGDDGDPSTSNPNNTTSDPKGGFKTPDTNVRPLEDGIITVEAKVIDDDGDVSTGTREVVAKTRISMINEVDVTASPSRVVAGETVKVAFDIKGSEVSLDSTWTADSYQLTNVILKFDIPNNLTLTEAGWTSNLIVRDMVAVNQAVSSPMTMNLERQDNGTYALVNNEISATFITTTTQNIVIPSNSVYVTYGTNNDDYEYSFVGGDEAEVVVLPNAPVLDPVNGNNVILKSAVAEVTVSGSVERQASDVITVDLRVTDEDTNELRVNDLALSDDNEFITLMDWTGFETGTVKIRATSVDEEGDWNSTNGNSGTGRDGSNPGDPDDPDNPDDPDDGDPRVKILDPTDMELPDIL